MTKLFIPQISMNALPTLASMVVRVMMKLENTLVNVLQVMKEQTVKLVRKT